jgi:hypothetical protein
LALDVQASPDASPGDYVRPLAALLLARARRAIAERRRQPDLAQREGAGHA